MPRAARDEITGDFRHLGYQQRMRAENSSLDIYDAADRGGGLLSNPAAMDLSIPQSDNYQFVTFYCGGLIGCKAPTWATSGDYSDTFHLNTIYLAQNGQNIFMTGVTGNSLTVPNSQGNYQNELYVLPPDGSCGSASCAQAVVQLPTAYSPDGFNYRAIAASSLAAGTANGRPMVAVGLTDGGLQLYDMTFPSSPQLTATWTGMATGNGSQTPVTALAFDPAGSGMLSVGVISPVNVGYVIRVQGDGTVGGVTTWAQTNAGVLSTAFGQRGDGSPVVAYGLNNATLQVIDPANTGTVSTIGTGQAAAVIVAINPIPRFWGTPGGSDFAVAQQTVPGILEGVGSAFRWDGSSPGMTALDVSAGSTPTITSSWEAFRSWYPGIKEGRFQVSNTSGEPITVGLQASPSSGQGCWYAPSWADAPAFPATGTSLAAGQTSAIFTMGAYTAGANGGCAATDATGTWLGYLIITPTNHPADARLVGLRLNRNMTVDVNDQAGGASTTVSITQINASTAAFGLWNITVGTPPAPTPTGSPTVTGSRITPADFTSGPAVYRFDVTGATYQLPTPYPNQLVVPPLQVQGSVNGTSWTTLGILIPRTEPTLSGSQLTLGPATFWWENPARQPAYQQIRVALGPAGNPSPAITLSSLPAPPDPTNISGPSINPTSSDSVARPVDSGVDLAPLSVQVLNANSQPLPDTDPSYPRIYYRNTTTNALITNLLLAGASPNSFLGVTPYEGGAYPNNGSAGSGQPGTFDGFHYLSTTSTTKQSVIGYIAGATSPSQPITVLASQIDPVTNATSAANGISLAGCADFANGGCRLYPISTAQPALYLDTSNGVQIGLLTAALATTSVASLPLQQTAGTAEHQLASAPLTVTAATARLTDTSAFLPNDQVDTTLVTHGQLAPPVVNVPVGS
jgi:hypothetical protein